jgi:hypothetical protein
MVRHLFVIEQRSLKGMSLQSEQVDGALSDSEREIFDALRLHWRTALGGGERRRRLAASKDSGGVCAGPDGAAEVQPDSQRDRDEARGGGHITAGKQNGRRA